MEIKYATICECGKRRNNEDSWVVKAYPADKQWIGIVCDGLGGHAMGEVASSTVTEALLQFYETHRNESDYPTMIEQACIHAYQQLDQKAVGLTRTEMGTTMVMTCISDDQLTIAHMGDSRCYLLNQEGELLHQTTDHLTTSFGWEVLSRCFMSNNDHKDQPEIVQFNLSPGDRILLCSDGLYKSMPPEILKKRLADSKTPEEILDILAFLCEKNGDDNYTGILVFVE